MREHAVMIDWLRFTVDVDAERNDYLPPHDVFQTTGELLPSVPNYTENEALLCARVDWNPARPEQRIMVTMTGADLRRMREHGLTDWYLLSYIADAPGINVTRMDLAVDTNDTRMSPAGLVEDWSTERFKTRARRIDEIKRKGADGEYAGHTVYIGSRESEQFLRVYDKAAEQGTAGHLTRVELELKQHKAWEALQHIVKNEPEGAILAAFQRFFRWSNAAWQDIIAGASTTVPALAAPEKNGRLEWIRKVALPAVIDAYGADDPIVVSQLRKLLDLPF